MGKVEYYLNAERVTPGAMTGATGKEHSMARTLSERLRAHEQQKARLAETEAKLKLDERKQRTRRLVEAGALVEKCGLLDLDSNALYGALLSLRDGTDDKGQVEKWAALGGRTFAREAKARDEGKQAVLLTFTAPLPKDATTALRKAGFRYGSCWVPGWCRVRHATRPAISAPSRALPRRRALCTNWKKPR